MMSVRPLTLPSLISPDQPAPPTPEEHPIAPPSPTSPPPTRYEYFLKGAQLPSVAMTGGKQNFPGLANSDTWWAQGLALCA